VAGKGVITGFCGVTTGLGVTTPGFVALTGLSGFGATTTPAEEPVAVSRMVRVEVTRVVSALPSTETILAVDLSLLVLG